MRSLQPPPIGQHRYSRARQAGGVVNLLPWQQGQLDGLCGLYTAVNSIVLLFSRCAPLTSVECYELFQLGLNTVAPVGELAATVAEGVDLRLWRKTVSRLADHAARSRGYQVRVSRPFRGSGKVRPTTLHRTLQAALDDDGVVLAMLCGVHNHFTVLSGHDASRYQLFDSGGLRWLSKAACGLPQSSARHRFSTGALLVLEVRS